MEKLAKGDVVPSPSAPVAVKVEVEIPPKYACVAESCVVEAFALNMMSVDVAFPCALGVNGKI